MTEQEVFKIILPFLEGYTEGIYWDFKETLNDAASIIKDILAFSNSDYNGDSFIIVGVKETKLSGEKNNKIALSREDRIRLKTDSSNLYIPDKWDVCGISEAEILKLKGLSEQITQQIASNMLISIPKCEFIPIEINKSRWLYVIIIKKKPGVFICKQDLYDSRNPNKVVVKQGVVYVRVADTTFGADTSVASATECIRIWKNYIDWLESPLYEKQEIINE